MYRYEVVVDWSAEDQLFIARVPGLPGCVAHGATPESAVHEVQIAIGLWVDSAIADGIAVPEPRSFDCASSPPSS